MRRNCRRRSHDRCELLLIQAVRPLRMQLRYQAPGGTRLGTLALRFYLLVISIDAPRRRNAGKMDFRLDYPLAHQSTNSQAAFSPSSTRN